MFRATTLGLILTVAFGTATSAADGAQSQDYSMETSSIIAATHALLDGLEVPGGLPDAAPSLELRLKDAGADTRLTPVGAPSEPELPDQLTSMANLTPYRLNWFDEDGLIGAIKFVGNWQDTRNLVCGYVAWDMSEWNAPTLVALEFEYLETPALLRLSDSEARTALRDANCAYFTVEANLALTRKTEPLLP